MDLRKVARNPGWWRLFIVFAGLWYGGWLIGAVVTFSEDSMNATRRADLGVIEAKLFDGTILEIPEETDEAVIDAEAKRHTQKIHLQAQLALLEEELVGKPALEQLALLEKMAVIWAELYALEAPRDLIPPPAPWYMDRDLQMFAAAIVLFPWFVFFNLRLMRYVIEGFRPERG